MLDLALDIVVMLLVTQVALHSCMQEACVALTSAVAMRLPVLID